MRRALAERPGHRNPRRLTAELFWRRFLGAEESGDEKEMQVSRRMVEQYNDSSDHTVHMIRNVTWYHGVRLAALSRLPKTP